MAKHPPATVTIKVSPGTVKIIRSADADTKFYVDYKYVDAAGLTHAEAFAIKVD
jgi:hypothetical protein